MLPSNVELVHNGHLPKPRKETEFHGVIHYICSSADRSIKQATCVSGKWSPEIECTGMFSDLDTISLCYVGLINAHY